MKKFITLITMMTLITMLVGCGSGEELEKLSQDLADAQEKLSDVKDELDEVEDELSEAEDKLSEAEDKLSEAETKVEEAEKISEEAEGKIEEAEERADKAEESLATMIEAAITDRDESTDSDETSLVIGESYLYKLTADGEEDRSSTVFAVNDTVYLQSINLSGFGVGDDGKVNFELNVVITDLKGNELLREDSNLNGGGHLELPGGLLGYVSGNFTASEDSPTGDYIFNIEIVDFIKDETTIVSREFTLE